MFTDENQIVIAVAADDNNAANAATVNSRWIDLAGFRGCCFGVSIGTIPKGLTGVSVKAQQSDDAGVTDAPQDVPGSSIDIPDSASGQVRYIDIFLAAKRYLRVVIKRGAGGASGAKIGASVAILWGAGVRPSNQTSTVSGVQVIAGQRAPVTLPFGPEPVVGETEGV